jgi:hypothetical protein
MRSHSFNSISFFAISELHDDFDPARHRADAAPIQLTLILPETHESLRIS